ncbi:DUF4278 domain-containing protein [Leptolyngbya ohadii]|uniref:DUF4278 domain-containing protein n=1 Tax=Leptolyngbya ohadii TaxID=1962290 RepID=UPI000B5A05B5|nr:DUF4278 domain-containing protein [Leptolyngbya ohadii]
MQLQYRGVPYSLNSSEMCVEDAPATGQYRGARIRFQQPVTKFDIREVLHLMYRGIRFDEEIGTPIV